MSNFIWPATFAATVIIDDTILPNGYTINISMHQLDKKTDLSLGFKKLRYFVETHLHNSVLIDSSNKRFEHFKDVDNHVIEFPSTPWDYLVGVILYNKFVHITDKYFEINYITIDSSMGDHVSYTVTPETDLGVPIQGNFWWNTDSPSTDINSKINWDKLNLKDRTSFSPRIIEGGLKTNDKDK